MPSEPQRWIAPQHRDDKAPTLVWIGQRGEDSDCIAWAGRLAGIVCCDWSERLSALSASGVPILSLERNERRRALWSSASLDQISEGAATELLERTVRENNEVVGIVCYRHVPLLRGIGERFADAVQILAPTSLDLDDKILQRRLFLSWDIPAPPSITISPGSATAANVAGSHLRFPVVVQRRFGSLGKETLYAATSEDLRKLPQEWLSDDQLLVSEYTSGPVININGVIENHEDHVAWPSIQLVGLGACGGHGRFLYCGNDFASAARISEEARRDVMSYSKQAAAGLSALGYTGVFGLDFVWSDQGLLVLEINPRFQGSTALLTALELRNGVLPTVAHQLAPFVEWTSRVNPDSMNRKLRLGSEVVLYADREGEAREVGSAENKLEIRGAPVPGTHVQSGAMLGRVRVSGPALRADLCGLRPELEEAVVRIRSALLA